MRKLILTILLALGYSQPQIEWESTFDNIGFSDKANYIQETIDGGYILTGSTCNTSSENCDPDIWVIKTNSTGQMEWEQIYHNQGEDIANEIQQTSDGGYIIIGWTEDGSVNNGGYPYFDAWVIKISSNGIIEWDRTFGSQMSSQRGYSIKEVDYIPSGYDQNWNYIPSVPAGYVIVYNASHATLERIDTQGETVWWQYFGTGNGMYKGYSLEVTEELGWNNYGYVITGSKNYSNSNSNAVVWVVKTDKYGDEVWSRAFGNVNNGRNSYGHEIKQAHDGGYIIAGYSKEGYYPSENWIIKLYSSGYLHWETVLTEGLEATSIYPTNSSTTSDDGYIIAGHGNNSDFWVVKIDVLGNELWNQQYGGEGNQKAYSILQASNGSYIVTGETFNSSNSSSDVWLISLPDGIYDCTGQTYISIINNQGSVQISEGVVPPGDGCIWDASNYGAADCDVAFEQFGYSCETLENIYNWDCTGCECPGDVPVPLCFEYTFITDAYNSFNETDLEAGDFVYLDFPEFNETIEHRIYSINDYGNFLKMRVPINIYDNFSDCDNLQYTTTISQTNITLMQSPNGDDFCGICNGDNSSCADCAGIPNGDSWESDCGCVDADNSGNDCNDCAGVPNGDSWESDCGCVDADNSGNDCNDCAGVPNGSGYFDNCEFCDDNPNNDCVPDCSITENTCDGFWIQGQCWGGNAQIDDCLICSGGNTGIEFNSYLGCDNICFSGLEFDECGMCGGYGVDADNDGICDNYDIDGDGFIDDTCIDTDNDNICDHLDDCVGEYDQCNVCGGDNSTCAGCTAPDCCNYDPDAIIDDGSCVCIDFYEGYCDCYGSILDQCGVCGGDGTSCETLGDLNGDGIFNVVDIVLLVNAVMDWTYNLLGDMNEDGVNNVVDVVLLVNLVLYGSQEDCDVELWGECYNIENTTSLNLSQNGLTGEIPPEIGNLINLTYLNLYANQLIGEIPAELGNLTNLTHLDLQMNQLSGQIPYEIGNLINLNILHLNDNYLYGQIPENICDLALDWSGIWNHYYQIPFFDVDNNYFCPPYPECLSGNIEQQDTSNCP